MINFILYENDIKLRRELISVIKRFFYNAAERYVIHYFNSKNDNVVGTISGIIGSKIYIIDIDKPNLGIEVAKMIRDFGDYISPILLLSSRKIETIVSKLNNIMYLDVIYKKKSLVNDVFMGLNSAYKIVARNDVYTFSIFDELYRIPYDEIYLIIKNVGNDSVTIYSYDDSYQQYKTIKGVEEDLKRDPRFLKVHRSCILNLYNIVSYDRKSNTVLLKNGMKTSLVSRNMRSALAKKLIELSCEVFV